MKGTRIVWTLLVAAMAFLAAAGSAAADARSLQNEFNRVADEVLPVVVEINTIQVITRSAPQFLSPWDFFWGTPEMEQRDLERPGLGSGVIVRREGSTVYVLSNNHVVGTADEISIRLHDGREFEAEIVGTDERTDLAVVSFRTDEAVPVARLGNSDDLDVGDWVLAVGNPFGFESTVTVGIVSALRRDPQPGAGVADFTDYIQTDAAINPGNSGGALVNLDGEVIGINTWIASRSGGSVGLGFAIPINNAWRVIDDLVERGRVRYGWLGVTIGDLATPGTPGLAHDLGVDPEAGALVTNLIIDSPADRDGLLAGDFVTSIDDESVRNARDLTRVIGRRSAGERVRIGVVREGRARIVRVRIGERPEEDSERELWPGFAVLPLSDEIRERLNLPFRQRGVIVANVVRESDAAVGGMRQGDLITEVSGRDVRSVRDFYSALADAGDEADFRIVRGDTTLRLGIVKE
ncbi:MAG: Do family serine endopeptidase [Spirochaetales bacterium]